MKAAIYVCYFQITSGKKDFRGIGSFEYMNAFLKENP